MKDHTRDKWEINASDVTIYEELGHGAFGKVCKGIMQASSYMKRRQSNITVAVKILQDMLNDRDIQSKKLVCIHFSQKQNIV